MWGTQHRKIKVKTSKRKWVDFKTYDLEWVPRKMLERVAGCFDGYHYIPYKNSAEFLDNELTAENSGLTYYAHNGGAADFLFLLPQLRDRGYGLDIAFSNSSANIVQVTDGRSKWFFLDSLWLFRSPLSKLGKMIGLSKAAPDFATNEEKLRWFAEIDQKTLQEYNQVDCEILWRVINAFQQELWEMGGELKRTIASTALNLFQRCYLTQDVRTNKTVNEEARQSYAASRVEVILPELDQGYYYDISSSFPYSMTLPQPGQLLRSYAGKIPDRCLENRLFLANVDLTIARDTYLPSVPYRHDGRIYFPTGRLSGWFTGVDIAVALERGATLEKVRICREFAPWTDLKDYVETIYEKRMVAKQQGKEARAEMLKILLNSLYGKLAEGSSKHGVVVDPTPGEMRKYGIRPGEYVIPGLYRYSIERPAPHEHVPAAAHITALSRYHLLRHMEQDGQDVAYCDTDSIATRRQHQTSAKLGDLKLEGIFERGRFVAPKVYDMHMADGKHHCRAKAFRIQGATDQETSARYEALISSGKMTFSRMAKMREMIGAAEDAWRATDTYQTRVRDLDHRMDRFELQSQMMATRGLLQPQDLEILKHLRGTAPKRRRVGAITLPWDTSELSPSA